MKINQNNLKNKEWRINNLYTIVDKQGQKIRFKRNEAQKDFNKNKWYRNIILKSRQHGFTTDECIDSLDDVLWIPNFKDLFISYDQDSAIEIFDDKIKFAWENYPEELRRLYSVDSDRANKLKFNFGDETFSSIIVRNKGRSGTFQRIHVSELAKICKEFPKKAKEIITGTIPAVPNDGRADIESTAEGEEGLFHDMFWDAWDRCRKPKKTEFKAHFYNWQWQKEEIKTVEIIPIEEMDESRRFVEYKAKLKREDGIELNEKELSFYYLKWLSLGKKWNYLQQEYPTTPEEAFISSGVKLFDKEAVMKLKEDLKDGKVVGNWTYYEDYIIGHRYAGAVDVAHGIGLDSSTIVIIDFTPLRPKIVAIYENNQIQADHLAHEVKNGGVAYGQCLMAVERNDRGHTTLTTLKTIYNNIYTTIKYNKEEDLETEELGWHTNKATKPKMMLDLSTAVRDGLIEVPSKRVITEMRTYVEGELEQISFDEEKTRHWDILTALAICWQMKTNVGIAEVKTTIQQSKDNLHSAI